MGGQGPGKKMCRMNEKRRRIIGEVKGPVRDFQTLSVDGGTDCLVPDCKP